MKTIKAIKINTKEGEPSSYTERDKIINIIQKNVDGKFQLLVDEDGDQSTVYSDDLIGEVVNIVDDTCIAEFLEGEDGSVGVSFSVFEGALPREETVKQLKKLRKLTKGMDIGDKISDLTKQGANISYIRNPVDTGIESIEDYWKKNKKFKPNKNLNIKKFDEFK